MFWLVLLDLLMCLWGCWFSVVLALRWLFGYSCALWVLRLVRCVFIDFLEWFVCLVLCLMLVAAF